MTTITRPSSPVRQARADALHRHIAVAWHGFVYLPDLYRDLVSKHNRWTRSEIDTAINDLVQAGRLSIGADDIGEICIGTPEMAVSP